VSAVGHETDVTIADFVADLRAPTPSAAAELVICTRQELFERIEAAARGLEKELRYRLADASRRFHQQGIERAGALIHRALGRRLQRVDELDYRMRERLRGQLQRGRSRSETLAAKLVLLSPLNILERGYAIVQDEQGKVIKRAGDAPVKSSIGVRLAEGRLKARVSRSTPAGSSELPS
jgi:exodeoxyribonuclease VII large subunit